MARVQSAGHGEALWVDAARHPDLPRRDDIVVVRVESGLFFANADHVRQAIRAQVTPATAAVVLDAETTPFIDVSATEMITQLAQDLRRAGVELLVAHGIGQIRDVLRRAGGEQAVLQDIYSTVDEAVASVQSRPGESGHSQ